MKRMRSKKILMLAGLLAIGGGIVIGTPVLAQTPVTETQEAPPAPDQLVPLPVPSAEETAEMPAAPSPMPPAAQAEPAPAAVPAPVALQDVPAPTPVEMMMPSAAPAPKKAEAPKPKKAAPAPAAVEMPPVPATPAELAIMDSADQLDDAASVPASDAEKDALAEEGMDMQNGYLAVKKNYDADTFDARLTTARQAMAQGRWPAALELFNDLYARAPDDELVLMGRAVSMQKMGQNAEALMAYESVLGLNPKNLGALTNMLGILKMTDAPAALEKLQQLQEIYPSNAEIAAQLGLIYGTTGDYSKALKYLDIADSLTAGNVDVLYNRAVVYDRMGNKMRAVELYRQIVAMADDLDRSFPIDAVRKRLTSIR